jgi:hypothetical protein
MSDKINKLHIFLIKREFTRAEDIIESDTDEQDVEAKISTASFALRKPASCIAPASS